MYTNEIKKYAELMKELNLTGLEVTENNKTIRLEMGGAAAPVYQAVPAQCVPEKKEAASKDNFDTVSSPMVGIFYAAPAENEDPYVKVGDRVKKGDTLCIVEAMKLMNEITSEYDGVIKEICVSNGATVDYGTVLFKIGR